MATQEEIDALPERLELKLKEPIKLGEDVHATLTFREPTAGELETANEQGGGYKSTVWALANMAGVHPVVIRKLTARQFTQVSAFLAGFTQDAKPEETGASA